MANSRVGFARAVSSPTNVTLKLFYNYFGCMTSWDALRNQIQEISLINPSEDPGINLKKKVFQFLRVAICKISFFLTFSVSKIDF